MVDFLDFFRLSTVRPEAGGSNYWSIVLNFFPILLLFDLGEGV